MQITTKVLASYPVAILFVSASHTELDMVERDFRREIAKATRTSDVDALASIAMELLSLAEKEVAKRETNAERQRRYRAGVTLRDVTERDKALHDDGPPSPLPSPGPPTYTPAPAPAASARARAFSAVESFAERLPERVRDTVRQLARGQRNPTAWAMTIAAMLDGMGVQHAPTPDELGQVLCELAASNREPTPLSVRRYLEGVKRDKSPSTAKSATREERNAEVLRQFNARHADPNAA